MRILFIAFRYPPEGVAGVAESVFYVAKAMFELGHQVFLVGRTPQPSLVDEEISGVRILRIPLKWSYEKAGEELLKAAVKFNPTLMEVHLLTGFYWQDVLRCKHACQVPLIHHLHIYSLICKHSTLFIQGKSCKKLCEPCVQHSESLKSYTSQVDGVVSVSQSVLDWHLRQGHFTRIPGKAISIGVTLKKLRPKREHNGQPVIGYMGRIASTKGLDWLMQTCLTMGLQLKIAGQGPKELVIRLNKRYQSPLIEWLGWVKQDELLHNVDVLVLPALWEEPLGRVVIESFSYGVPVIASRVGGVDALIQDGVNGWGIHPDEPESLQRALQTLIEHEPLDPLTVQKTMWDRTPEKVWQQLELFYEPWLKSPEKDETS